MKKLFILIVLLMGFNVWSQDGGRIEIEGQILVIEGENKEGIAVYNNSSNKGTITNEEGKFTIEVKENDLVVFSALQYNDVIVIIDKKILNDKSFRLELTQ